MKITLIQKRPWKNNGYSGIGYAGFAETGEVVEFTSNNPGAVDHPIFPLATKFDPKRCEDIEIGTKVFQGIIKHFEITPEQAERLEQLEEDED